MRDIPGYCKRVGIVVPSINTIVQGEFDAMRPRGVTNHVSRIFIRDRRIGNEEAFGRLIDDIGDGLMEAVDTALTVEPDILILAFSAPTFRGGIEGGKALWERVRDRAGVGVVLATDACRAALGKFGNVKRLAVVTPYPSVGHDEVRRFFGECGYEVVTLKGLRCESPLRAGDVGEAALRDIIDEINDPSIEAIVQVGTNLATARVAAIAEFWLDIPVIAMNTATYWWALRQSGVGDKIYGLGSLLEDF
jgi:maleate isomerase